QSHPESGTDQHENAPPLQSHQKSSRPFSENHSRTLQKGPGRKRVAGEITTLESEKCYDDVKANADWSLSLHWPEPSCTSCPTRISVNRPNKFGLHTVRKDDWPPKPRAAMAKL